MSIEKGSVNQVSDRENIDFRDGVKAVQNFAERTGGQIFQEERGYGIRYRDGVLHVPWLMDSNSSSPVFDGNSYLSNERTSQGVTMRPAQIVVEDEGIKMVHRGSGNKKEQVLGVDFRDGQFSSFSVSKSEAPIQLIKAQERALAWKAPESLAE